VRIVIGAWVLFTVGLLALLVSCPAHAQTRVLLLDDGPPGELIVRADGTIAATVDGYVCVGLEPYRADCHPSIGLPAEPPMETWHERAIALFADLL
jgi:hypothetical protein